jgi:hypothetical protein
MSHSKETQVSPCRDPLNGKDCNHKPIYACQECPLADNYMSRKLRDIAERREKPYPHIPTKNSLTALFLDKRHNAKLAIIFQGSFSVDLAPRERYQELVSS